MLTKIKLWIVSIGLSLTFHNAFGTNLAELNSQEKLNELVGSRACMYYKQLNACSRYPNQVRNEHPHIPGDCWEVGYRGSNIFLYKNNKNITVTKALNKIFHNQENILDCATASYIVLAKCLSDIFENSFDELYQHAENKVGNTPLPLPKFLMQFCIMHEDLTLTTCLQAGGIVQFRNFPNYGQLNPLGNYANDNLITYKCPITQNIQYMGLGEEYKNGPLSYEAVRTYMLSAYNIGFNRESIAYKLLDIDTIVTKRMGFEEGGHDKIPSFDHLSAQAVKECIWEKEGRGPIYIHPNPLLQSTVLDFMQIYPVFCLSLEKLKAFKPKS